MAKYVRIDNRPPASSNADRLYKFLSRTFGGELFVGLWVVLRNMLKRGNSHTLRYPMEKFVMPPRYRGVHKLMRLLESGSERCIGCGLCEKICVANCIAMQTSLGADGRKKVNNYSINLGRCVYCGLCADVCPEIAIVHGCEYELASEQRAYYGFKRDFLIRGENLCLNGAVQEFAGYGSLDENAGARVKLTPTAYVADWDAPWGREGSKESGAASSDLKERRGEIFKISPSGGSANLATAKKPKLEIFTGGGVQDENFRKMPAIKSENFKEKSASGSAAADEISKQNSKQSSASEDEILRQNSKQNSKPIPATLDESFKANSKRGDALDAETNGGDE